MTKAHFERGTILTRNRPSLDIALAIWIWVHFKEQLPPMTAIEIRRRVVFVDVNYDGDQVEKADLVIGIDRGIFFRPHDLAGGIPSLSDMCARDWVAPQARKILEPLLIEARAGKKHLPDLTRTSLRTLYRAVAISNKEKVDLLFNWAFQAFESLYAIEKARAHNSKLALRAFNVNRERSHVAIVTKGSVGLAYHLLDEGCDAVVYSMNGTTGIMVRDGLAPLRGILAPVLGDECSKWYFDPDGWFAVQSAMVSFTFISLADALEARISSLLASK
ncbi:MAG: hypothetical protein AAB682_01635 [Patescibacteria group bacterium]